MVKITVISDTHIPKRAKDIPLQLWDEIKESDLILHAGDVTEKSLLETISLYTPIKAVRGNMDSKELTISLPDMDLIEVEGIKIGLTHGWGEPKEVKNSVRSLFQNHDIHILVFGHSHQPEMTWENGILYLNPGSPTDTVFSPYLSFAQLKIHQGQIVHSEILRLP